MAQRGRNRSEPVDGLLLLNKPAGLTSNQALQKVKKLLRARKAGHTGSLDPAATGMLPLCFGEATKVCPYLLDADKTYRVTARLGVATDTGDREGKSIDSQHVPALSADRWQAILEEFLGASMQVPPMYSALKQGGKRLYEMARRGETVDRQARPVRIDAIELLEIAGSRLVFRVRCSKGTYIRTLVEDIAGAAGTVAYTARLHREVVGHFPADEMLELDALEAIPAEQLRERLIAPDKALTALPAVNIAASDRRRFSAGQALQHGRGCDPGLVRVYAGERDFLGVGELSANGELAPRRVFRMDEKNP